MTIDLKQISIKIGCSFQTNSTIMKDQFSNYVIQKMIDMAKLPQPQAADGQDLAPCDNSVPVHLWETHFNMVKE